MAFIQSAVWRTRRRRRRLRLDLLPATSDRSPSFFFFPLPPSFSLSRLKFMKTRKPSVVISAERNSLFCVLCVSVFVPRRLQASGSIARAQQLHAVLIALQFIIFIFIYIYTLPLECVMLLRAFSILYCCIYGLPNRI